MKIYDAFDRIQDMPDNIPQESLYESTNVNIQNIKNKVFSSGDFQKKKKPFGKAFKLTVIAATLAVALIVGTTAIHANGGIERIREFFSGSMNAGLYDGGNVEVTTSDPNLNVELLAVTGDNDTFYAVIQAEKKDGTTFTDEEYIYPPHGTNGYIYVSCQNQSGEYYTQLNGNTTKKYHLSDDRKTLKIFVSSNLSSPTLKDTLDTQKDIMTVKSESLTFHKIKEVIAVYDRVDVEVYDEFLELVKQKNITEKWTWLETPEGVIFCITDAREYEVPFEITFNMKHDTDNNIHQSVPTEKAPHFIKNTAHDVKMDISSFGIRIMGEGRRLYDYHSESEMIWYLPDMCFERVDPEKSKIILDNGTEYYFEVIPNSTEEDDENKSVHVELELNYSEIPNPTYTVHKTVIDTRQIKEIIINGDTVYSK